MLIYAVTIVVLYMMLQIQVEEPATREAVSVLPPTSKV